MEICKFDSEMLPLGRRKFCENLTNFNYIMLFNSISKCYPKLCEISATVAFKRTVGLTTVSQLEREGKSSGQLKFRASSLVVFFTYLVGVPVSVNLTIS